MFVARNCIKVFQPELFWEKNDFVIYNAVGNLLLYGIIHLVRTQIFPKN